MINLLRDIIRPKYEPLNVIEIDAAKLRANYRYLKSLHPEAAIIPVLKSNAYGHGLKEVCLILNQVRPEMIAVDSYPEAQIAYRYFKGKVLIIGEMPLEAYDYCKFTRTEFVVYNESTLKYLAGFRTRARIHLFVNTGMNREGIQDLGAFISENKEYLDRVEISGLCSHLSSAEDDSALNQEQEAVFLKAVDTLREAGFSPNWIHLGNSAAALSMDNKVLTAYRSGLSFYGYNPFAEKRESAQGLQPALEVYSRIVSARKLPASAAVSYNETYHAEAGTYIGTIPFGYFEGLDRRLSSQAQLLVGSNTRLFPARIAGRVCMNLTCLDLGDQPVNIGATVKVISADDGDPNTIDKLAGICGTIPYELLVKLQTNIRRKIINY